MTEAGQGGGEMDVLAGYIANPIGVNDGVRFTVIDGVTVTASLEGRREGRGAMIVMDGRSVRFPGIQGQTVKILLEQIPLAQQPGFRELGDDDAEPAEGSSSKTDEQSESEESSEEIEGPDEEDLPKELEQKLKLSPKGKKKEKTPVDPQSEVEKLKQSLREHEAMNELLKLYMENLEDKESNFIKGNLANKKLKDTPGIDVAATERLNELGISTTQALYDKYKEGRKEFEVWAIDKTAKGVGMQPKYCKAVIRAYTLREMYPDQ